MTPAGSGRLGQAARQVALLELASRLPAPILAERFGFHQARAARWVREAGRTYADYVALRADPRRKVFPSAAH